MILSLLLGSAAASIAPPTRWEFESAQADHVINGGQGMVHCNRFRRLQCRPTRDRADTVQCSYRQYAAKGPWPLLRATLRWNGEEWCWLTGDAPRCSIMFME